MLNATFGPATRARSPSVRGERAPRTQAPAVQEVDEAGHASSQRRLSPQGRERHPNPRHRGTTAERKLRMLDVWQQAQERLKTYEQNGFVHLRLANDGDRYVVVFLGNPLYREVTFVDGKYVDVDERMKAEGYRASMRFAMNVALYDTKQVKVYEFGAAVMKDMIRLRGKYGLEGWSYEVQRHGGPRDPKTTYTILPERQLTAEQQREFQALKRHDLERLYRGGRQEQAGSANRPASEGVDPNVAAVLVAELKTLPREMTDRFLQKFGIQRVKELPAAHVQSAQDFLAQLQAELTGVQEDAEIDPFA